MSNLTEVTTQPRSPGNSNSSVIHTSSAPSIDTRIDIDDGDMQSGNNYSIRNATGSVQQNISSILNQARSELERRTEQTRMWRLNLNNVLNQGVRPLIQQSAQYNESFRVPQFERYAARRESLIRPDFGDGVRIAITTENHSLNVASDESRPSVSPVDPNNTSRQNHPILDRVAALTRTDPPDLIERPNDRQDANAEGAFSEVLSQVPDARRFLIAVTGCIPFVCILLVKALFDNFGTVFDVLGLAGLFYNVNSNLREQVAKHANCRKLIILRDAAAIILGLCYIVPYKVKSYGNLFLIRVVTNELSLGSLLYSTIITDYILKLLTVLVKMMITILPAEIIAYKRRGRFYMLVEAVSQLYRAIAPIQLWLVFLTYSGLHKIFGSILAMAYMVPKFLTMLEHIKFLKKSIAAFPRKVRYGSVPTKENIEKAGEQCPICHDNFHTPVLLDCKHVFCENCVGTWFNTEQTCPMCRAKVAEDPSWLDGATSNFVQCF